MTEKSLVVPPFVAAAGCHSPVAESGQAVP
nr:MAG TPA: Porphobilinogen deaminase, C-terminal domain [Caudoviricetes sp.]